MVWEAWFTLAVVAGMLAALAFDLLAPVIAILSTLLVLLLVGILTPQQALSGFSNSAPFTVAALYVLARAAEKTGILLPLVQAALGGAAGVRGRLLRLLVPAAGASAFLNNTPIVAMLSPLVANWADRNGVSPSRYLMPLSFAVILGGVGTTIGTSTNLVVSGLMEADGFGPMGLFEITRLGLPAALAGIAIMIVLAPILIVERKSPRRELSEAEREFLVSMVVAPSGPLDGRSVEAGGLRHLQGVFLVDIERDGERIGPVAPHTVLRGGDRLTFVGRADLIVDLQRARGLESMEQQHLEGLDSPAHTFFEAVVGKASPLVGTTLREIRFRERYQAAVIAIHRAGERVQAKFGGVELQIGDTLLLLADPGFQERWRDRSDFLLISRLGGDPPAATRKAWIVGVVAAAIVLAAGGGLLPIFQASLIGAGVLVALRVLTPGEARNSVDLDVVLIVAASLGIGVAIEESGLASELGALLVGAFSGLGRTGVVLGVAVATVVLTEVVTNNAAAAVVFPIAMAAAADFGADPRPFALVVAVAASCSFLTPIGYQTNTMVYGPGGYRFGDYARFGFPLTIVVFAVILASA
jgi:di/tricarboxylate transporter